MKNRKRQIMSNKKQKSPYKNVIFAETEKKVLDKGLDLSDNNSMEGIEVREFTQTVKAYVPFLNSELDRYEMFTVFIDPISNESKIERRTLRDNSIGNAILEMQKLYGNDQAEQLKKLKRENK